MGQAIFTASVGTSALCVAGVHDEPIASCALWNVSDTQQRIAVRIVPVLRLASESAHPRVRRCFALVGLAARVMRRRCIARASCVRHTRFRARALVTVFTAELNVLPPGNSLTSCVATAYQAFHKYSKHVPNGERDLQGCSAELELALWSRSTHLESYIRVEK